LQQLYFSTSLHVREFNNITEIGGKGEMTILKNNIQGIDGISLEIWLIIIYETMRRCQYE